MRKLRQIRSLVRLASSFEIQSQVQMQTHILYSDFLGVDNVDNIAAKKEASWKERYTPYILIYEEYASDLTIVLSIWFPILLLVH